MPALKYSDCLVTDASPELPLLLKNLEEQRKKGKSTVDFTHILSVDGDRIKDFFYVDGAWLWKGSASQPVDGPHIHDYGEVMGFVGANEADPHDLGGEIVIWLDGVQQILTRSCLIYIPAGVPHCPVRINRIDHPIFTVTISLTGKCSRQPGSASSASPVKPRYTLITDTKALFTVAASGSGSTPARPLNSDLKSTRLLHLEDDMAKGSFYVDFVWIYKGRGQAPAPVHSHEWVELIAMAGADPEHPQDIGGTMSIDLEGVTQTITKSTLVCIPRGLKHCPWKFVDIQKPTLVFTAGPSGMYTGSHKKE